MFLRSTNRKKDGKDHRYCSIVENRRLSGDRTAQRTVLYLKGIGQWPSGEISNLNVERFDDNSVPDRPCPRHRANLNRRRKPVCWRSERYPDRQHI